MKYIVEDYLEYIQDEQQGSKFLIIGGLLYAAYKHWKNRQEIINGYCKKEKGESLKLEICVCEVQIKNSLEIIRQIERSKHTCEDTQRPNRCYEKVRYYLQQYNDRIVELNNKIYKLKLKLAKREYKEKMKKYKNKNRKK